MSWVRYCKRVHRPHTCTHSQDGIPNSLRDSQGENGENSLWDSQNSQDGEEDSQGDSQDSQNGNIFPRFPRENSQNSRRKKGKNSHSQDDSQGGNDLGMYASLALAGIILALPFLVPKIMDLANSLRNSLKDSLGEGNGGNFSQWGIGSPYDYFSGDQK
jgi:hypothetical protein